MGGETITFDEKNATQFIIKNRQPSTAVAHSVDDAVYKPVTVSGSGVTLLTMGVIYNLDPTDAQPYASVGDEIQISDPGFKTIDPKIVDPATNQTRWLLSQGQDVNVPTLPAVATSLDQVTTDVTAIFEDDQYYYITSSGCLLYTSPSPRDLSTSRMPSSA